jgi:hypothetical protein
MALSRQRVCVDMHIHLYGIGGRRGYLIVSRSEGAWDSLRELYDKSMGRERKLNQSKQPDKSLDRSFLLSFVCLIWFWACFWACCLWGQTTTSVVCVGFRTVRGHSLRTWHMCVALWPFRPQYRHDRAPDWATPCKPSPGLPARYVHTRRGVRLSDSGIVD